MHAIIGINKILAIEHKSFDPDSQQELRVLPINSYDKINKLLRNLIIFSSAAIEETQIEVYVQNSESFFEVIGNCLKYINAREVTPYDLIGLLLNLIKKITLKAL